jgi:hypothetical protein
MPCFDRAEKRASRIRGNLPKGTFLAAFRRSDLGLAIYMETGPR